MKSFMKNFRTENETVVCLNMPDQTQYDFQESKATVCELKEIETGGLTNPIIYLKN